MPTWRTRPSYSIGMAPIEATPKRSSPPMEPKEQQADSYYRSNQRREDSRSENKKRCNHSHPICLVELGRVDHSSSHSIDVDQIGLDSYVAFHHAVGRSCRHIVVAGAFEFVAADVVVDTFLDSSYPCPSVAVSFACHHSLDYHRHVDSERDIEDTEAAYMESGHKRKDYSSALDIGLAC